MTGRCIASVIVFLISAHLAGCAAPPSAPAEPATRASVDLSRLFSMRRAAAERGDAGAVPAHLNSPRAAAQEIATSAQPIDRSAMRTVRLHASLYRAAIDADQGHHSAYLLNPPADDVSAGSQSLSAREFRLRVLAEMTGLAVPVAWDAPRLTWMFDDRTEGGPAGLAWFEILKENPELASVEADVCIESPRTGTRKFRVEAIYDGERWNVRDLGARTVW